MNGPRTARGMSSPPRRSLRRSPHLPRHPLPRRTLSPHPRRPPRRRLLRPRHPRRSPARAVPRTTRTVTRPVPQARLRYGSAIRDTARDWTVTAMAWGVNRADFRGARKVSSVWPVRQSGRERKITIPNDLRQGVFFRLTFGETSLFRLVSIVEIQLRGSCSRAVRRWVAKGEALDLVLAPPVGTGRAARAIPALPLCPPPGTRAPGVLNAVPEGCVR